MWPYILTYVLVAFGALGGSKSRFIKDVYGLWYAVILLLTLWVGFRYEVGGDWLPYLLIFDRIASYDLTAALSEGDPAYNLLNWVSSRLDWGIFGVNIVVALVFSIGLTTFCRKQPLPWLALTVAVPYIVIVVGMGYSRQAAALGLEMTALNALTDKKAVKFVFFILAAASFHRTALILMPLLIVLANKRTGWLISFLLVIFIVGVGYELESLLDTYNKAYFDTGYDSQGAVIRLSLNLMPSMVVILLGSRFRFNEVEKKLWTLFAVLSITLMALIPATPSTTAIDRIALYLLPLQIIVFSRLPDVLSSILLYEGRTHGNPLRILSINFYLRFIIILLYGLVEIVWLTQAQTAFAWLPYRSWLFE